MKSTEKFESGRPVMIHLFIKPSLLLCTLLSTATPPLEAQNGERSTAARSFEKDALDQELIAQLKRIGFTGNIEATLEHRLGSPIDPDRANDSSLGIAKS